MKRITVNFGQVLEILRRHAPEMMDKTGILSINGLIVDAVVDRIKELATLSQEEKVALTMWCPRVGATFRQGAGGG